jgi:hypothetical protein
MSFDRGRIERQHKFIFARLGQRFKDCAPSPNDSCWLAFPSLSSCGARWRITPPAFAVEATANGSAPIRLRAGQHNRPHTARKADANMRQL